jgi:hypothetical protein
MGSFSSGNPTNEDWLHLNSIDYNAEFDQIILSSHSFSEVWIIDHSTNTVQAASHSGGAFNKGGDLLFRWGNPQTYDQGTAANQLLFKQHDAHWISDSLIDGGMIMVFNNQAGSPSNYSEVNIINPPVNAGGNYTYSGSAYAPTSFHWSYQAPTATDFYSSNISGAQRLPNGNTLICDGPAGTFFEVDYAGNSVWEYISPVSQSGITTQGSPVSQNNVFRSYRYPLNYSGFNGQTLTPQGYIESGSTFSCSLFTTGIKDISFEIGTSVYPNPAQNSITISSSINLKSIAIYNMIGERIVEQLTTEKSITLNTTQLYDGIYLSKISFQNGQFSLRKIIIEK